METEAGKNEGLIKGLTVRLNLSKELLQYFMLSYILAKNTLKKKQNKKKTRNVKKNI